MRAIYSLLVAATAVALSAAGCSSDNVSPVNGAAGEAGANGDAGATSSTMCVSVYADYTPSAFVAKASGKGCDAADASVVCSNDLIAATGACGKGCLGMGDDAAQAVCVGTCLDKKLSKPLTATCTGCYEKDVECARKNCLLDCGLNPLSEACAVCRSVNGCAATFYGCSGLPVPTGLQLGGGAGAGGAGGAGPGDLGGAGGASDTAGAGAGG